MSVFSIHKSTVLLAEEYKKATSKHGRNKILSKIWRDYSLYTDSFLRKNYYYQLDEEERNEILVDVYLKKLDHILLNIASEDKPIRNLVSYLNTVAHNMASQIIQSKKKHPLFYPLEHASNNEAFQKSYVELGLGDVFVENETSIAFRASFSMLEEKYRSVLIAKIIEGDSYEELIERFSLSYNNVRHLIQRGKEEIRRMTDLAKKGVRERIIPEIDKQQYILLLHRIDVSPTEFISEHLFLPYFIALLKEKERVVFIQHFLNGIPIYSIFRKNRDKLINEKLMKSKEKIKQAILVNRMLHLNWGLVEKKL